MSIVPSSAGSSSGATGSAPAAARRGQRRPGWRVVAAKEFSDHLLSVRFYVLALICGLAGVAAVRAAASGIREAAPAASEAPAVFLSLFTASPQRIPSYFVLVGFLGPLLGIAFGFDAINAERSQGTLPRLAAQPIYRDDIVNGKFAGALGVIGVTLTALTAVVSGLGLLRLGIVPGPADAARLLLYLLLTGVYVGVWLAMAILASVVFRRAATSVLVAFAAWLVFTVFWSLLAGIAADGLAPVGERDATFDQTVRNARLEQTITRFSPQTLYEEATAALLNPEVRSLNLLLPEATDRAVAGSLPLPQSLLVAAPQITALVALTLALFAAAYVNFMRQEIRA